MSYGTDRLKGLVEWAKQERYERLWDALFAADFSNFGSVEHATDHADRGVRELQDPIRGGGR